MEEKRRPAKGEPQQANPTTIIQNHYHVTNMKDCVIQSVHIDGSNFGDGVKQIFQRVQKNEGNNSEKADDAFPPALTSSLPKTQSAVKKLSSKTFLLQSKPLQSRKESYHGYHQEVSGRKLPIAIKFMRKTKMRQEEVLIILKLADHPNIVKIHESGLCNKIFPQIFIAMELCGQNLGEYIRKNLFDLPRANDFFAQTVSAIEFIHDNKIAHGDLKPSNILISADGESVKVSDFGITKEVITNRRVNSACGEGFKAPEVYKNETENVSYKADIFSLAICGYYTITHGEHPFGSNSYFRASNITKNVSRNLSELPAFSESNKKSQLKNLLKRMLMYNPTERPTASQVRRDVFFSGT